MERTSLQNAIIHSNPENIFFQNIFGNYDISRNNQTIKKADFPQLVKNQILQVGDLFCLEQERLFSWEEFKIKYSLEINFLSYEGPA